MGLDSTLLPDSFKRLMADRPKGKEFRTQAEAEVVYEKGFERELHVQFENWCNLNNIQVIHSRMDRRTTNEKGVPDFVCCFGGHVVFVEYKAHAHPLAHLTEEQECWRLGAIASHNQYLCTNDLADAIQFTKKHLMI